MEKLLEKLKEVFEGFWGLNANQIAIISLIITLLLFVAGKRAENKIKIYETRKEEYQKLIDFFIKIFSAVSNKEEVPQDDKTKKEFLDMGASLAIYGSKKLYKTYCFYRLISLDEKVQATKWYSKDMPMYCLGEMFQIMRKEIGLNHELIQVDVPDVLSFYLTDFSKPQFKKNFYKYHYNKLVLKSIIFWGKVEDFIPFVWVSNYILKPFFLTLYFIIRFPIKLLIVTPIKLIIAQKAKKEKK